MCTFPSWIESEGQVYFLTDKDLREHVIDLQDGVGHHAIEKVYGVKGDHIEGFENVPKKFVQTIHSGACRKMMEYSGYKSLHFKDGLLHREDGPAIEWTDGTKHWYRNGQLHRENGPAVEWANGTKEWYRNGQLHRKDGPAVEWTNGKKYWYRNGEFHREDGPAIEWADGDKEWYHNGTRVK